jgi:hypothetical protein
MTWLIFSLATCLVLLGFWASVVASSFVTVFATNMATRCRSVEVEPLVPSGIVSKHNEFETLSPYCGLGHLSGDVGASGHFWPPRLWWFLHWIWPHTLVSLKSNHGFFADPFINHRQMDSLWISCPWICGVLTKYAGQVWCPSCVYNRFLEGIHITLRLRIVTYFTLFWDVCVVSWQSMAGQ